MSARNTKHQDPNTMENPLELELILTSEPGFALYIGGCPEGTCIGVGKTEKDALENGVTHLESALKLIQENPQAIGRFTDEG